MKQYNKINNLVGWLTFLVAAITYCMTIEPTASFWDCFASGSNGEYHECFDECGMYPFLILEYYASC